jgi:hypothetical protein
MKCVWRISIARKVRGPKKKRKKRVKITGFLYLVSSLVAKYIFKMMKDLYFIFGL